MADLSKVVVEERPSKDAKQVDHTNNLSLFKKPSSVVFT